MWRSRIFWRLFAAYGVLVLSSLGLLGTVIIARVERQFLRQIEDSLRTKAILIREAIPEEPVTRPETLQQRMETTRREIATRITLIDAQGNVLADSEIDPRRHPVENHADRPEIITARSAGFGLSQQRHSATLDQEMMYVALRNDPPRSQVAFVRVALPLDQVREQLAGLHRVIWTAAGLTAAAAVILAFWLARRSAQPLQELTEGAERIAAGDHGHKVYAVGHDEIGTLARAFNHMSERLQSQFAQIEEDRRQLRAVLSGMVEGVIALDADQRILFTNERAGLMLGFDSSSATGRKLWEVVRQRSVQELARHVLDGPETSSAELDWNGAARNLVVHAARLTGPIGHGSLLVFHDTSNLRRLERLRQEFVANVSHELKRVQLVSQQGSSCLRQS